MSISCFQGGVAFNPVLADSILKSAASGARIKQKKLDAVLRQIENNVDNQKGKIALDIALDPNQKDVWENIATHVKAVSPLPFTRINELIEDMQEFSDKIKTVCAKHGISLTDYRRFISPFGGSVNAYRDDTTPLLKAISENWISMIKVLTELGADTNLFTPNKKTPLKVAIADDKRSIVKCLIACGADVNLYTPDRWTPLTFATHVNSLPIVKILIFSGANVNLLTPDENVPITTALENGNIKIIKHLILSGAEINVYDSEGASPYTNAIDDSTKEIIELLEDHDADQIYAKEYFTQKLLAHIWGIGGHSFAFDKKGVRRRFDLEGLSSRRAMILLTRYVQRFFSSPEGINSFDGSSKREIVEALENAYPVVSEKDAFDSIKCNLPCIIMGGWKNHAISMVIYNDHLFVCNRGVGKKEDAVEIYDLSQVRVSKFFLDKLCERYSDQSEYERMFSDLNLILIDGYNQKPQKVGNCTWASAKAAFGVLCRCYSSDNKLGWAKYKRFGAYSREKVLQDYLKNSQLNQTLINSVKTKAVGKSEKAKAAGKEPKPFLEKTLKSIDAFF